MSRRTGWFVAVPLSWIVLGALLAVGTVAGFVALVVVGAVTHPADALQVLAFIVAAAALLYGFCWWLGHRPPKQTDQTPND